MQMDAEERGMVAGCLCLLIGTCITVQMDSWTLGLLGAASSGLFYLAVRRPG